MNKLMGFFLLFLFCASNAGVLAAESFRTPFSNALERALRGRKTVVANPGTERLRFMRFYFPKNTVNQSENFWTRVFASEDEEAQERAAAFYLFNMYVSTAAYGEDVPARLTTDYLGVLDGFGNPRRMFSLKEAESFYNKHKPAIKTWLQIFFDQLSACKASYDKNSASNDKRERAFMRLLAQAPAYHSRPGYYIAHQSKLAGRVSASDASFVSEQVRRTLAQNKRKVVVFEQPSVPGEDLDRKIGIKSAKVQRTYRYVNDECDYCSYEFGKRVCQVINTGGYWGGMRMYKITAVPLSGRVLLPFSGDRFTLFSGSAAPKWSYHTATLLVMNRNGKYTPMVVDKFLAGEAPMEFAEWQALFSVSNTLFYAVPFVRTQAMENAAKTPNTVCGSDVLLNGYTYVPETIEW